MYIVVEKVLSLNIELLKYDKRNPRKHNPRNIGMIEKSLQEIGAARSIVIDEDNNILAGNGTIEAAHNAGITNLKIVEADGNTIIAVKRSNLSEKQKKRLALLDNRTAETAEWDADVLSELVDEVGIKDIFSEKELLDLGVGRDVIEEDDVPIIPQNAITVKGDLYQLGAHRLLCGDSTISDDVAKLMDTSLADILLTDPPYNVDYTGGTKEALKVSNDKMEDNQFYQFLLGCFSLAFGSMKPGASFYIFHADSEGYNFRRAVKECGHKVRQCLIWKKQTMVLGRQDYQWQHEPCLYGWKDGAAHGWYSNRKQTTILEFDRPTQSLEHPTMKPVEMICYLIGNSTAPQGLVYDPFLGSGTTLISADKLGRTCYGMELDVRYCDVIVSRYVNLTGKNKIKRNGEEIEWKVD